MNRPTCGTCPHYVSHNAERGSCRVNPPMLLPRVHITRDQPADGPAPKIDAAAKTTSYAFWPGIRVGEACCSHHPIFAAWAKGQAVGTMTPIPVPEDDPTDDPFA